MLFETSNLIDEDNIIFEIRIHEDFKRIECSKFYNKFHVTSLGVKYNSAIQTAGWIKYSKYGIKRVSIN